MWQSQSDRKRIITIRLWIVQIIDFHFLIKSVRCLFIFIHSFEYSAFSSSFNHHCELWSLRPISLAFFPSLSLSVFSVFVSYDFEFLMQLRWIFRSTKLIIREKRCYEYELSNFHLTFFFLSILYGLYVALFLGRLLF